MGVKWVVAVFVTMLLFVTGCSGYEFGCTPLTPPASKGASGGCGWKRVQPGWKDPWVRQTLGGTAGDHSPSLR